MQAADQWLWPIWPTWPLWGESPCHAGDTLTGTLSQATTAGRSMVA